MRWSALQAGKDIERGGVQTLFRHQPFRELGRLGLDQITMGKVREHDSDNNGMLVVSQVIKGAVADGKLEEGDILVSIDNEIITDFIDLEAMLDAHIGQTLPFRMVRQGKLITRRLTITDLQAIMPSRLLELGDAVLQNMSIQHARAMNRPRSGVVAMRPGYMLERAGIPQGSVIVEAARQPVAKLDDLIAAVRSTPDGQRLAVRYIVPGREYVVQAAQLEITERWFGNRLCDRVDDARFWQCQRVQLDRPAAEPTRRRVLVPPFRDPLLARVAPGMVKVDFDIPMAVDNVYARHFSGVGLVVDRQRGLVAVDRNTVPIALGDVQITFFGSTEVEATVVFLHPRHNVALLQYDTSALGDASFKQLELSTDVSGVPDSLTMIGYRADGTYRRQPVKDISEVTVNFDAPRLPRFQQTALDLYAVNSMPPSLGGPLVDDRGMVHAIYMSFAFEESREIRQQEWAIPAAVVAEALRMHREGQPFHSLDVQLGYASLAQARQLGLPDAWLGRFAELDARQRRVLMIEQVVPSTDAADTLVTGDILLAIDGTLVSDLFQAERLAQNETLLLTVLRNGQVVEVDVRPSMLDGRGTERLVSWAGAVFQAPHNEIGYYNGVDFPGVYIADTASGSPALWDGLYRNRFVTAVDGTPVTTLDEFLGQVSARNQDEITRLSLVTMSGRKQLVTVQPEYHFWPTYEIVHEVDGWQRIDYRD